MKKVITYGTFDLLHNGHINLLKRARELGDYLIVGVTSDSYDKNRGKLNVRNDLVKRIEDVRNTGFADKIIIEEYFGQKIEDIQKYNVDIFAIGSDWLGQFDYLNEYCRVVYLERTKGVSSTQLRNEHFRIINLGIIGSDGTAADFMKESKFVSGIEVVGVLNPESVSGMDDLEGFLRNVDAVYIGRSALSMTEYIRIMLNRKKHVLFEEAAGSDEDISAGKNSEKPDGINPEALRCLYREAQKNSLVLLEAVNTAYFPAFHHLINQIKSKKIGEIRDISLSIPELSSSALLPIIKFLGDRYLSLNFYIVTNGKNHAASNGKADMLIRGVMQYGNAIATFQAGKGAKLDCSLIISGTAGYACVPAPWWKTESFELRFDDESQTEMYFYKLLGNGSRYVIQEFVRLIQSKTLFSNKLLPQESAAAYAIIEKFRQEKGFGYAEQ